MFKIYFYNFDYYSSNIGNTLDEAKEIARKACFQCTIYDMNNERVISYCPLSGFSRHYPVSNSKNPIDYLRKA